jgi:hypothetical protein
MTTDNKTATPSMNSLRFIQIVNAYGSDPKRWPESERDAAITFSQRGAAQDILRREESFDAALDQIKAPEPSDLLKARILKTAKAAPPIANNRAKARPVFIRRFAAIAAVVIMAITVTLSTGVLGIGSDLEEPLYETADDFIIADMDAFWDEDFFVDPI